jgi:hypothetical protein
MGHTAAEGDIGPEQSQRQDVATWKIVGRCPRAASSKCGPTLATRATTRADSDNTEAIAELHAQSGGISHGCQNQPDLRLHREAAARAWACNARLAPAVLLAAIFRAGFFLRGGASTTYGALHVFAPTMSSVTPQISLPLVAVASGTLKSDMFDFEREDA